MNSKTLEPKYMDYVKHKRNDTAGTVIAVYPVKKHWFQPGGASIKTCLDVRSDEDRIYYATPAENWDVVRKADE